VRVNGSSDGVSLQQLAGLWGALDQE